jgi:cob(I)alamin adenosyltransferase
MIYAIGFKLSGFSLKSSGIMVSLTKIYTRTGDAGDTGILGARRVPKDDPLIEAYGTVDELNSILGLIRTENLAQELDEQIACLQNELFDVGADLAAPWQDRQSDAGSKIRRVSTESTQRLESEIDAAETQLKPLTQFVLPGGSKAAALLHVARTVCRRAERRVAACLRNGGVNPNIGIYLNRLSDWLFVMARLSNAKAGASDTPWTPHKKKF